MPYTVIAPPRQLRVVYRESEARSYLAGEAELPSERWGDPLYDALAIAKETVARDLPELEGRLVLASHGARGIAGRFEWHAVTFALREPRPRAGSDAHRLEAWLEDHLPDLLFALEDDDGRPLRLREAIRRAGGGTTRHGGSVAPSLPGARSPNAAPR